MLAQAQKVAIGIQNNNNEQGGLDFEVPRGRLFSARNNGALGLIRSCNIRVLSLLVYFL